MSDHETTGGPGGSVQCSCGATSPRFGTNALRAKWIRDHRREMKEET
jgi:hypothetical protein